MPALSCFFLKCRKNAAGISRECLDSAGNAAVLPQQCWSQECRGIPAGIPWECHRNAGNVTGIPGRPQECRECCDSAGNATGMPGMPSVLPRQCRGIAWQVGTKNQNFHFSSIFPLIEFILGVH